MIYLKDLFEDCIGGVILKPGKLLPRIFLEKAILAISNFPKNSIFE
jgi:hypothetical protein